MEEFRQFNVHRVKQTPKQIRHRVQNLSSTPKLTQSTAINNTRRYLTTTKNLSTSIGKEDQCERIIKPPKFQSTAHNVPVNEGKFQSQREIL